MKVIFVTIRCVIYVFHEAAWGSVPKSINQPLDYTHNNIVGTHNMMHSAYVNNVKKLMKN